MRGTSRDVLYGNGQSARFIKMEILNMIKSLKSFVALVACVFSVNSFAGLITDVEREGVATKLDLNIFTSAPSSVSWTHNILDQGFVLGTALSASLAIEFWDDGGFLDGDELASVKVAFFDLQDGEFFLNPTSTWLGELGANTLAELNADGSIGVKVFASWGDFYVGKSTLRVFTADVVNVPESSSLVLLALGLLGLGVMRKKARA
jgi:hypothetical protein